MSHEVATIRDCTLYRGDCLEILPTLGKVDAVVTDPPYGISHDCDYTRFTNGQSPQKTYAAIAHDDKEFDPSPWLKFPQAIMWGANCYSNKLPKGGWLVWDKRHKNGTAFVSEAEVAWKSWGHGTRIYSETCQGYARAEKTQHPTQKAVGLMMWCIEMTKAETILDPFMGSGTTGVACANLGRKFIGIELEPKYFDIACKRIEKAYADQALFDVVEKPKEQQPELAFTA